MDEFQSFNKRNKRWVKYKRMPNGQTRIVSASITPYTGVRKK